MKKFSLADQSNSEDELITCKKRKNAVIEVLKFICQEEFKVPQCPSFGASAEQIYRTAEAYILNGDLKSAVRHLTKNKKPKLALILSQAIHSKRHEDAQYLAV